MSLPRDLSRIFLIGAMGSGKTTVGKAIAEQLHWEFIDSDQACEAATRMSISEIFAQKGAHAFRKYEAEQIDELSKRDKVVLATGGGSILIPENRRCLQTRGVVIFLNANIATQVSRTEKSKSRPLLGGKDRRTILQKIAQERGPLYQATADFTINVDHSTPQQLAHEILSWFKSSGGIC